MRGAGIDPAALKDPDSYIPYRRVIAVIERAADVLNCPDFGMRLGERSTADVLGPLSVAMHHAPNAREALALAQRYMHFHNPALFLSVSRLDGEDDFVRLDLRMRGAERHPQPSERGVVVLHRFLTTLCGAAYKPKEVCFVHEPVSPLPVYRAMFGIVPHFGAPESGIAVARALLDRPQLNHNAQLRRIAEHYLETVAPRPPEGDAIAGSARAVVLRFMRAGGCTQEDLANALGLHERTLQRRLKAEDTSFEALRDDVRRELAQSYLAQKDVPLSHIAEMLGYAESSAFTRAARRWFGETPRDVRRRMTG
jgi:AraC-like DNA-binding protein